MKLNVPAVIAMSAMLLSKGQTMAQSPAPAGVSLADFAARRHPQPVRVGDLIDRRVLQPIESRPLLGRVLQIIRLRDGTDDIIIHYGGWFGFGGRPIAVPIDAMVLLGNELEILDFTPNQLNKFPTYQGVGGSPLAADEVIRMGLAHPSH